MQTSGIFISGVGGAWAIALRRIVCICLACVASSTVALAQETPLQEATIEDYRPLLDNSPFLSLAFKDRLAKSESAGINQFSFNGYTRIDDEWRLCLIRKSDNIAFWVRVGEPVDSFTVSDFDPKKQSLTLEKNGIEANLKLEVPK